jgi:hypothetical protein
MEIVKLVPKNKITKEEYKAELVTMLEDVIRAVKEDEIDGVFVLGFAQKGSFRWQYTNCSMEETLGRIEVAKQVMMTRGE